MSVIACARLNELRTDSRSAESHTIGHEYYAERARALWGITRDSHPFRPSPSFYPPFGAAPPFAPAS